MRNVYAVEKRLVQYLIHHSLGAGDRLPSERQLSGILETSRPTLRKVLAKFQKSEAIKRRGQAGTFILKPLGDSDTSGQLLVPGRLPKRDLIAVMLQESQDYDWRVQLIRDCLLPKSFTLNLYYPLKNHQDPVLERKFLESALNMGCRGVLVHATPLAPTNEDILRHLTERGVRVAHVGHFREDFPDQAFFLPDYEYAGTVAACILAARGYRKIAVISKNTTAPFYRLVRRGIAAGAAIHGLAASDAPLPLAVGADQNRSRRLVAPVIRPGTAIIVIPALGDAAPLVARWLRTASDTRLRQAVPVGIGDYDPGLDPVPPLIPLVTFSWKKRVVAALEFLMSDQPAVVHQLYKPTLGLAAKSFPRRRSPLG